MPVQRRGQPTIYLDQSTLSDAYKAIDIQATDSASRRLRSWIERTAREANVCLSPVHLIETSCVPPRPREAFAAWLEMLPKTWVHAWPHVARHEDEALVARVCGLEAPEVDPFTDSFIAVWADALTPERISSMLDDPTLTRAIAEIGERSDGPAHTGLRGFMPGWHERLHGDRAAAEVMGVTEEALRDRIEENWRRGLRERAGEAFMALEDARTPGLASSGWTWGTVMDPFVHAFTTDERELPSTAVVKAFSRGFEKESKRKQPGSRKARKAYGSMTADLVHSVAAAYCDVFTCDAAMARCLGDVRERLGKAPPICRRRGEPLEAFVDRLAAT